MKLTRARITEDAVMRVRMERTTGTYQPSGLIPGKAMAEAIIRDGFFHFAEGGREWVLLLRGDTYNLYDAYSAAIASNDPERTPNGYLLDLKRNSIPNALEFFERFGPLIKIEGGATVLSPMVETLWNELRGQPIDLIDLTEFWKLHARFTTVARLWNERNDEAGLRRAWESVYDDLEFVDSSTTETTVWFQREDLGKVLQTGKDETLGQRCQPRLAPI